MLSQNVGIVESTLSCRNEWRILLLYPWPRLELILVACVVYIFSFPVTIYKMHCINIIFIDNNIGKCA